MTSCPIPGAVGHLRPEGTCANGVLILGEAMGDSEVEEGLPFRPAGASGSVLERAINRIGTTRAQYVLWNSVPCQPPHNKLAGTKFETAALEWGREYLEEMIDRFRPKVILALGGIPTRQTTGMVGKKMNITYLTGYVLPGLKPSYPPVVPCFHPAYLRRGKMSHLGVLMRCLRLAIQVAREGLQPILPPMLEPPPGYILYPTEAQATEFLYQATHQPKEGYLAYDIETFYSAEEDEEDAEENPDAIRSIQFSLAQDSGIYLPWREPYIEIAKRILATPNNKAGHNVWRFDNPLLRANGCTINGENLDTLWAWHHLQPDLPRGLQFVAAMQGPRLHDPTHSWKFPWKHVSGVNPAYYGIVDVDVISWLLSY
jgi:uracil-DNA glycosylase family 4